MWEAATAVEQSLVDSISGVLPLLPAGAFVLIVTTLIAGPLAGAVLSAYTYVDRLVPRVAGTETE